MNDILFNPTFAYKATVLRVVDGDTVDLLVDLGFDTHTKQRIRMHDVWAAEIGTGHGTLHATHLQTILITGCSVTLNSIKVDKAVRDKYGRFVGIITKFGQNVNQLQRDFIGVPQGRGVKPA